MENPSSMIWAVRCFWTCLSVPAATDSNTVSAISVSAWKKLVLVQSLQFCENFDDVSSEVVAAKSSTSGMKSFGGSQPSNTTSTINNGPLATPTDMTSGMSRFLSQAKSPPGSRSLQQSARSSGPTSTRQGPSDEVDEANVMHVVEMESAESGNDNDIDDVDTGPAREGRYPSLGVRVYIELVKAYIAIDRTAFNAILEEHATLFRSDGNWGLVSRVGVALLYRQIYELSQIYSVVAVSQLSTDLGLPEADVAAVLNTLSTEKGWPVRIRPDGVVIFPRTLPIPQNAYSTVQMVQEEFTRLTRMMQVLNVTMPKPNFPLGRNRKDMLGFPFDPMLGSPPRGVEDI